MQCGRVVQSMVSQVKRHTDWRRVPPYVITDVLMHYIPTSVIIHNISHTILPAFTTYLLLLLRIIDDRPTLCGFGCEQQAYKSGTRRRGKLTTTVKQTKYSTYQCIILLRGLWAINDARERFRPSADRLLLTITRPTALAKKVAGA